MKRLLLLLLSLLALLSACSDADGQGNNIFTGLSLAEKIDCDWLFLPKEAVLTRTEEVNEELRATFKGCEFKEINAYAKELYDTLTGRGCNVFNSMDPMHPYKLTNFEEAKLDIGFAGLAYSYYYTKEESVYMLTLYYYGSAGGTYGNGQSVIVLCDVSDKISSLVKE